MNKTRKSHRAHNKENFQEAEAEVADLQQRYQEVSRYFKQAQKDIEQKATDHLSYLSQVDENLPASRLNPLHHNQKEGKGDTLSAWEDKPRKEKRQRTRPGDCKKYRGFSFWTKRNSLAKDHASSSHSIDETFPKVNGHTNSVVCYQHRQKAPTLNPNELNTLVLDEPTCRSKSKEDNAIPPANINAKETLNQPIKGSASRDSLSILKQKLSSSNLNGFCPDQSNKMMVRPTPPTEIEWLKKQILCNLNQQTVINRAGQFLECHRQSVVVQRPKSSYTIQRRVKLPSPPPPTVLNTIVSVNNKHNTIKLSSLIDECDITLQPQHMRPARQRHINRALRLSEEPKRNQTRAIDYSISRALNRSQIRLSNPKSVDRQYHPPRSLTTKRQ